MHRAQLGFVTGNSGKKPGPDCPDPDVIKSVAAGACSSERTLETIHHAACCEVCGPLLKRYQEEFSEDFTDEEETFLSALKTSGTPWQSQFVQDYTRPGWFRRVAKSAAEAAHRLLFEQRWRLAAIGTALVAFVAGIYEWPMVADKMDQHKVKTLAQQALCEQPTLEMRIPYGCYAPFQKQMGDPTDQKSESLLEAQRILTHKKKAGPLDREWLQDEGLTSLVSGMPGSASRASIAFERAQHEGLDDPGMEIELAVSYFESGHTDDLPKTIDVLEGVLKRPKLSAEDRRVALFDLAVAYEAIDAWPLAVAKWQDYLKLDSSSEWAPEAKLRRDKAQAKIPAPKPQSRVSPAFPDHSLLQSHAEDYQDIALRYWLPEAIENPGSDAARASHELAVVMELQHSDPWLSDLLRTSQHNDLPALRALAYALSASKRGLYRESIEQSQDAATIFAQHRNLPGEYRARLEEVYAHQRTLEATRCLAGAERLGSQLSRTKYRWLQAQLAVEKATCLNFTANLNAAQRMLVISKKIAEDSNFPILGLRILGLNAGIDRLQDRDTDSWKKGVEGLAKCSGAAYHAERLFNFYSILEQYAEKKHLLRAQEALLRNAIAIREADSPEDKNAILEGQIYGRLSVVSLALKEDAFAKEAARKSNLLLNSAPEEPYSDTYVLSVKFGIAEAQLQLGDAGAAISTLEPASDRVRRVSTKWLALRFYRVLGEGYRQVGRLDAAAATFGSGVAIVEQALSTLNDKTARLKWIGGADPIYRGLTLVLLDQGKDGDALALWEWYRSRALQDTQPVTEFSWNQLKGEIFRTLPAFPSETRLIYASFDDRLQLWVVNARGVKATPVKIRQADLERQVSEFAFQCSTPPNRQPRQAEQSEVPEDLRKSSRALSALFLDPIMSEIAPDLTVVVELDPRLAKLPIAALICSNGHYFAQDQAIVLSAGMFWDKKLRNLQPIGTTAALLLAQGTNRLPGQAELSDRIRNTFPKTKIVRPEKTPWIAAARELKNRDGFVFIGHGLPEAGGTSLIYGDSRISASDFPLGTMKSLKFAVLEACSTGEGGENGLLETANLVHPFLSAGVPSVIASRWDVDSESTADLMASFFEYLGRGEAVPRAMFHARNVGLTRRSHPYYWAGLDLVGRAN